MIGRKLLLLAAVLISCFQGSMAQCSVNLTNMVVREGTLNVLEFCNTPKFVQWTVTPNSNPLGGPQTISNYDNNVTSNLKGIYAVNNTGLTIFNATITPNGTNPATAGLYIVKYANTSYVSGAKLVVIRQGPLCSNVSSTTNQLNCTMIYDDYRGTAPINVIFTWLMDGQVISTDQPLPKPNDAYTVKSTSTITVNSTTSASYQCQVTFSAPNVTNNTLKNNVATNAPNFTDSCTVLVTSNVTTPTSMVTSTTSIQQTTASTPPSTTSTPQPTTSTPGQATSLQPSTSTPQPTTSTSGSTASTLQTTASTSTISSTSPSVQPQPSSSTTAALAVTSTGPTTSTTSTLGITPSIAILLLILGTLLGSLLIGLTIVGCLRICPTNPTLSCFGLFPAGRQEPLSAGVEFVRPPTRFLPRPPPYYQPRYLPTYDTRPNYWERDFDWGSLRRSEDLLGRKRFHSYRWSQPSWRTDYPEVVLL